MKKNLLLLAVIVSGIAFNSCNKVAQQISQTLTWNGVDLIIDIPPTTAIGTSAVLGTATFSYNLDSFIKDKTGNVLGLSNVEEFKFQSCKLTIMNPNTAGTNSFGAFSDAKAMFSTNTKPTPVVLGEVTGNPAAFALELDLPINTTTNMKSYLPNSGPVTISYELSGTMRNTKPDTTKVAIHAVYSVHIVGFQK
ncbi:MAG: hypothetical protein K0Q79_136 [Flavipsychrobacter sp.]|jgi:hypothetical protein|nr:hypothetical protein [Flavipsychrobacter sp.]